MAKSRKRKKKKKKSKSGNSSKKQRKIVDGIEFILDGKNVLIKNKRTKEEHDLFIQKLTEQRPELYDSIEKRVNEVVEIFKTYDNFKLLGHLAYNHFRNLNNIEDDGLSEVTLEYGLSFASAIGENPQASPKKATYSRLSELLILIRKAYKTFAGTEVLTGRYTKEESNLRFTTILEALHIRGNGYMHHVYEVYRELFKNHDEFLRSSYGFDSSDLLEAIQQFEESWFCRGIHPNGIPFPHVVQRFESWQKENGILMFRRDDQGPFLKFLRENPDLSSEIGTPLGFYINDPKSWKELYRIRFRQDKHKKVAEALSSEFGNNEGFLNPKFPGLPLNDTLTTTKPIIKHENKYYHFNFNLPTRYLFQIVESLMRTADSNYFNSKFLGNKYYHSRDNYLERKVAELFSVLMPDSKFYPNLKYKPGIRQSDGALVETELDLLVVSENANFIIEIKAGNLSDSSKRGGIKSLLSQLENTVGYAAYQSHRAYEYIMRESANSFYNSDVESLNVDNQKKIFRITITLEHLAGFISRLSELKELNVLNPNVEFAWNCSLFDLRVFCELLENEADLIDYLEKRIPLLSNPKIRVEDEIDLLAFYLEHNRIIDDLTVLDKVDSYTFNKMSQSIDDYFQKGGIKPQKRR